MPFQTFDEQGDASNCAPRLAALRAELANRGVHGFLIPRADEHQGEYVPRRAERLAWLTGFDPRFEEAVLIVGPDGDPAILVGNECWGMAGAAPLPMRRHRFQDLSLPSQPRDRSRPPLFRCCLRRSARATVQWIFGRAKSTAKARSRSRPAI